MILLTVILAVSGALSYFIPQGHFQREVVNEVESIIPGTYTQGEVRGIAVWKILTAPVRVFNPANGGLSIIMISLFLLIMSGVFNLMEKTGGIKVFIGRIVRRFTGRNKLVI